MFCSLCLSRRTLCTVIRSKIALVLYYTSSGWLLSVLILWYNLSKHFLCVLIASVCAVNNFQGQSLYRVNAKLTGLEKWFIKLKCLHCFNAHEWHFYILLLTLFMLRHVKCHCLPVSHRNMLSVTSSQCISLNFVFTSIVLCMITVKFVYVLKLLFNAVTNMCDMLTVVWCDVDWC